MEESCNIYVHFMRKKLYVQTTRTNYTVNIRDAGFTEFTESTDGEFTDWIKYDRTNRTEFYGSDEYDQTHHMKRELFIFNLLMQQS